MKTKHLIWITIIILSIPGMNWAKSPHQIGPFILNHDINEFSKYIQMDTAIPIRHMESIHEVEIKPIKGFKSGLIAFGTCAAPNRVARIKLKYKDGSKDFYKQLKKRMDKRYGECDEYRGDPFHIVLSWKWSFTDENNQKISLILQHNARDTDEKMGNSIKLTMTSLMEAEYNCYKDMQTTDSSPGKTEPMELEQTGWDLYLPK